MKHSITIKTFIKDFHPFIDSSYIPTTLNNLSYEEKLEEINKVNRYFKVYKNEERIYFVEYETYIKRIGRNFFKKKTPIQWIYISNKEISIKCGTLFILKFLEECGITWFKEISCRTKDLYFDKVPIFKGIIIGTIYSEETLYRAIARRIYHTNVSWKIMKQYCELEPFHMISFYDLKEFTKNLENSISIYCSCNYKTLLRDVLHNAIQLNQTVNFRWSHNRILSEHLKQIEKLTEKEINSKSQEEIYETEISNFPTTMKLLNTEKDIFLEGSYMHHCLYHNYYRRIKYHSYIAFHLIAPEECTLGINFRDGKPIFDQVYLRYDKHVKPETEEYCKKFISDYEKELIKLFSEPFELEFDNTYNANAVLNQELPW